MQRHSTAACFATYLLPHVLFVADAEERGRIARICCLAWNIALFPDAAERERHAEGTLDLLLADEAVPPPSGFRQGFGGELRMLVDLKRDLFPWRLANVMGVDLEPGSGCRDVLVVDADGAIERIELALSPSIMGAHIITGTLVQMHRDTRAQRATLEEAARRTPELLERAVAPDMLTAYCMQRADLRGYHRMLAEWRETSPGPELEAGIGRFLAAVAFIGHKLNHGGWRCLGARPVVLSRGAVSRLRFVWQSRVNSDQNRTSSEALADSDRLRGCGTVDEVEQNKFVDQVVAAALQIRLANALGTGRQSQSYPVEDVPLGATSFEEIKDAKAEAEKLIRNPVVLERLCPALTSISQDLESTAKTVGTVMLTMAAGPHPIVALNVLAFGALAVILVRAGVNTICPGRK